VVVVVAALVLPVVPVLRGRALRAAVLEQAASLLIVPVVVVVEPAALAESVLLALLEETPEVLAVSD
jgi:hypothetical protein